MKKLFFCFIFLGLLVSCSPETNDVTTTSEVIDFTMLVNPDTTEARPEFDTSYNGLYKGVFVSDDMDYHGVLTVNLGNDGRYNAILQLENGTKVGFISNGNIEKNTPAIFQFTGANGGFSLDVTDFNSPVVQDAFIDGQNANIKLLKESSSNRVRAILGTFADDLDPTYNGTWDLISTGTSVVAVPLPTGGTQNITVNLISETVVTRNGVMFTDASMEAFTPGAGCGAALPPGSQMPFFSGEQTVFVTIPPIPIPVPIEINEYAIGGQTSVFGGQSTTWSFIFTKANGNLYYDIECNSIAAGVWSRNGRSGSILLNGI